MTNKLQLMDTLQCILDCHAGFRFTCATLSVKTTPSTHLDAYAVSIPQALSPASPGACLLCSYSLSNSPNPPSSSLVLVLVLFHAFPPPQQTPSSFKRVFERLLLGRRAVCCLAIGAKGQRGAAGVAWATGCGRRQGGKGRGGR